MKLDQDCAAFEVDDTSEVRSPSMGAGKKIGVGRDRTFGPPHVRGEVNGDAEVGGAIEGDCRWAEGTADGGDEKVGDFLLVYWNNDAEEGSNVH